MTDREAAEVARVTGAVSDLVEQVFVTVSRVRESVLSSVDRNGLRAGSWVLPHGVQELLREPGQLAVGLGLVVAPRPELDLTQRLEWWQVDPDAGGQLHTLEPDLRPMSLGYYDYTTAEWYDVPRRTGRRHAFGPHVDVHGTGRYLLTLTEPVVAESGFVGVAGADVPVRRFEASLLEALGHLPVPFVVLNDEERIVLSTAPRWLVGALVPPGGVSAGPTAEVPGTPWRVQLVQEETVLRP